MSSIITISVRSLSTARVSCDIDVDGHHIPYVAAVDWTKNTLTITQIPSPGSHVAIPVLRDWTMPGAVISADGSRVSTLAFQDCRGSMPQGEALTFTFWIDDVDLSGVIADA